MTSKIMAVACWLAIGVFAGWLLTSRPCVKMMDCDWSCKGEHCPKIVSAEPTPMPLPTIDDPSEPFPIQLTAQPFVMAGGVTKDGKTYHMILTDKQGRVICAPGRGR